MDLGHLEKQKFLFAIPIIVDHPKGIIYLRHFGMQLQMLPHFGKFE